MVNALSDSKMSLGFSLNVRHHYPLTVAVCSSNSSFSSSEQMGKVLKGYSATHHQEQHMVFSVRLFIILVAFPRESNLRK